MEASKKKIKYWIIQEDRLPTEKLKFIELVFLSTKDISRIFFSFVTVSREQEIVKCINYFLSNGNLLLIERW